MLEPSRVDRRSFVGRWAENRDSVIGIKDHPYPRHDSIRNRVTALGVVRVLQRIVIKIVLVDLSETCCF